MEKPKIVKKAWRTMDILVYGETRAEARNQAIMGLEWGTYRDRADYFSGCKRDKDFDFIENPLHELAPTITDKQKSLMIHALGERRDGMGFTGHRNYYASSRHEEWENLVIAGFATKRPDPLNDNSVCYHVSELGQEVLASMFPIMRYVMENKLAEATQPIG